MAPSTDMLPYRLVSETVFASTQHCSNQKAIRQDHSQDQSNQNLMVMQESLHGNKARTEDWGWAISQGLTWNSCHTTNSSNWTNIHYNSIVCRLCTSQRERACLDRFWTYNNLSWALSTVSQHTGLKTPVILFLLVISTVQVTHAVVATFLHTCKI